MESAALTSFDITDNTVKLCVLNEFFYPDMAGGTGTALSDLVRKLYDGHSNIEIDVITSRNEYRRRDGFLLPKSDDWNGVKIKRLNSPHPNRLRGPLRLLANIHFSLSCLGVLLRRRYDLVLVASAPPTLAFVANLYHRLVGVPYVYLLYDLEPDRAATLGMLRKDSVLFGALKRIQRDWLKHAEEVVVLGRCMREHVSESYGLPLHKLNVIPVGADPELIDARSHKTRFRQTHELAGFVVLYSGNFGKYHDFDTVLDAATELANREDNVRFVLVGAGAKREHIEARIKNELIQNARLYPFVPDEDYADLLASADVSLVTLEPGMEGICVPSKFYSTLASGRPTVAIVPPNCEVAYVIEESNCGMRVDHADVAGLVDAITSLARDEHSRQRMGANARRALEQRFSSRKVADSLYQVLASAVRGRSLMVEQASRGTITWYRRPRVEYAIDPRFQAEVQTSRAVGV